MQKIMATTARLGYVLEIARAGFGQLFRGPVGGDVRVC